MSSVRPAAPRALLLIALLATAGSSAVPAAGASDVEARNIAFLLSTLGLSQMPEGSASLHAGGVVTQVPVQVAFEEAAARAGTVDLAAIAAGAASGTVFAIGDLWVFETGVGSCYTGVTMPSPIPGTFVQPQFSIYAGDMAMVTSSGGTGMVVDWTAKQTTYYTGPVDLKGQSDLFCFSFSNLYLFFPFVTGIVTSAAPVHRPAFGGITIEDSGSGPTYTATFPGVTASCVDGVNSGAYVVTCTLPAPGAPYTAWQCTYVQVGAIASAAGASVNGEVACLDGNGVADPSASTGDVTGPSGWTAAQAAGTKDIVTVECKAHPVAGASAPQPPYTVSCAEP